VVAYSLVRFRDLNFGYLGDLDFSKGVKEMAKSEH